MTHFRTLALVAALATVLINWPGTPHAASHSDIFSGGWTLEPGASSLRFQSVKNMTKVETSGFATFSGEIAENGEATVRIALDSVDTKVDLRNVRMRFLFFETFQFPEAVIKAQLDPALLADLPQLRRKIIPLPYTMTLHGITKSSEAEVAVTMISDTMVAVSTSAPISVATSEYSLDEGVKKLEEAANVAIVPSATVTFDFVFQRADAQNAGAQVAAATRTTSTPASTALEAEGDFDAEACKGRFEILSRTGNIFFRTGSARLDPKSEPLLNNLVDIVSRCPGMTIEVSGHTDSDGSNAANQALSERRAAAVTRYMVSQNIPQGRIQTVGYGESQPAFPNDSADNKRRNRRIEFSVVDQ
jgi:outer membrane protein OmpA-like peptidoglycan-associated protein